MIPARQPLPRHRFELTRPLQGRRDERGVALVLVVVMLALLIGFVGLALDTALVRTTNQELQAAADAASLAAAERIDDDDDENDWSIVRQAGIDCAAANSAGDLPVTLLPNGGNAAGGDIVVGIWRQNTRTFTPDTTSPNAVRVLARKTADSPNGALNLFFGGIFGANTSDVSRSAIAVRSRGTEGANVIILHPTMAKAFDMRGNTLLVSYNGGIHVNSTHASQALYINGAPGDPRARTGTIRVVGASSFPTGSLSPAPIDGSDPIPDPLIDLPYPDHNAMVNRGGISAAGSYEPGYYPNGIDFNNGEALLAPGVYSIGAPRGVRLRGSALLRGAGVMLFLAQNAPFAISGNGAGMVLTAPNSGTYQGLTIFGHRASEILFDISGTGTFDLEGTMYMAGGHLEMDGNVSRQIGRIIVDSLQFRGNGTYEITGEGPPDTRPLSTYLVR